MQDKNNNIFVKHIRDSLSIFTCNVTICANKITSKDDYDLLLLVLISLNIVSRLKQHKIVCLHIHKHSFFTLSFWFDIAHLLQNSKYIYFKTSKLFYEQIEFLIWLKIND